MGVLERRARVVGCRRCPRLVATLEDQIVREPLHHNAPVVDRGDARARLLLVGLAPGRLGANRTGRAFDGDSSSEFLFNALHSLQFASSGEPATARLVGARLTNVVKCLPPANQPKPDEVQNCSTHLQAELADFWTPRTHKPRVIMSLGGLAHRALWRALPSELTAHRPCPAFSHGGSTELVPGLLLMSSFHPSKLNTQTGRLTQTMLQSVLRAARDYLAGSTSAQ